MALPSQSPPSIGSLDRRSSRPPRRKANGNRLLVGIPVLLVEGDGANRKLMDQVLTHAGAFVTATDSTEDALVVLEYFRPRAIVLELISPAIAGLAFLEKLRAEPEMRDVAVIVVSASGSLDVERAVHHAGCAAHVGKPVDIEAFPALVERALTLQTIGGRDGGTRNQ